MLWGFWLRLFASEEALLGPLLHGLAGRTCQLSEFGSTLHRLTRRLLCRSFWQHSFICTHYLCLFLVNWWEDGRSLCKVCEFILIAHIKTSSFSFSLVSTNSRSYLDGRNRCVLLAKIRKKKQLQCTLSFFLLGHWNGMFWWDNI